MWAGGGFASGSMEEMAIRNAAAQGAASTIDDILTLDSEAIRSEHE